MSLKNKDDVREERITMEIVVDTYNEQETAMGWYCYLDDKIEFPFNAECFVADSRSPLIVGEKVNALCMGNEESCIDGQDMYVEISWNGRVFSVPLAQLKPLDANEDTVEAISDWHYWKEQGYLF